MTTRTPVKDSSQHVLLLFSGGVDSTVCAHLAKMRDHKLTCMFVSYGQLAAMPEYIAARAWCVEHGVRLIEKRLSGIYVAAMDDPPGVKGPRVVPARNGLMLWLAVNTAAAIGANEVWFGATDGDRKNYPDCRAEYVESMNRLAYSTERVSVKAPLIDCSRAQVLELASAHNIDLSCAWSCYAPTIDGTPCGTCDSCSQESPHG